ncbi:MAG: hypothetical protein KDC98_00065 [Planctomycetes bacterium]|nr:hypothetical protein [Planctomycetota bacterium]
MNTHHGLHFLVLLPTVLGTASAQSPAYAQAYVLAAGSTPTVTIAIDLATTATTIMPPQASDVLPPLAIEHDPTDGSFLVALANGSSTQVMRRHYQPTVTESQLGTVQGHAVELLVDRFGDVIVVTGGAAGAIQRLPRHGGPAQLIRSAPYATAAGAPQVMHWNAIVGTSGSAAPLRDPAIADLDLDGGNWNWGPYTFAGFTPRGITGLIDLPTGVPRQLLAHDDGSLSVYTWAIPGNPIPLLVAPVLPAGGIAAMKSHDSFDGFVLGGAANPYFYWFDPMNALGGTISLSTIAGPLPGTPIDYTVVPQPQAGVIGFGRPCGIAAELRIGTAFGAGPVRGNASFGLVVRQALPLLPAWLVMGFTENRLTLPTGCRLEVASDAIVARWTDANGDATQTIPIPNSPWLLGVRFFGQWLQLDGGAPFMTSDTAAVTIG